MANCPECGKAFATVNTLIKGDTRVRYYGCRKCKKRDIAPKTVPLQYAPRRSY